MNARKIAIAVEAQRRLSPYPSDRRNPPGADEKTGITFLPFLDTGPAELSAYTGSVLSQGMGWHRAVCLLLVNQNAPWIKNTCPRKLLELLPYLYWGPALP